MSADVWALIAKSSGAKAPEPRFDSRGLNLRPPMTWRVEGRGTPGLANAGELEVRCG